jgi:L-cystine transport system permease protein
LEFNVEYLVNTFFLALSGIPITLGITVIALLVATPIGFFIAIHRIYNVRIAKQLAAVYVSFIRGTPIVLQILIIYSLLPSLLNLLVKGIGWNVNVFNINPILYACIVFSLNASAGLSEIFRSALLTVNKGQLEAAYATGMTTVQAYVRILIPQALVVALPNICTLTINLIKGTSLAFLMTVQDITAIAKVQASYGYNYVESYLDIFLIYIIVCATAQLLFTLVEKHLGSYKLLKRAS